VVSSTAVAESVLHFTPTTNPVSGILPDWGCYFEANCTWLETDPNVGPVYLGIFKGQGVNQWYFFGIDSGGTPNVLVNPNNIYANECISEVIVGTFGSDYPETGVYIFHPIKKTTTPSSSSSSVPLCGCDVYNSLKMTLASNTIVTSGTVFTMVKDTPPQALIDYYTPSGGACFYSATVTWASGSGRTGKMWLCFPKGVNYVSLIDNGNASNMNNTFFDRYINATCVDPIGNYIQQFPGTGKPGTITLALP
jgi:hypothetical protein